MHHRKSLKPLIKPCVFAIPAGERPIVSWALQGRSGRQKMEPYGEPVHPTVCFFGAQSGAGGPRARPAPRQEAWGDTMGIHWETL